MNRRTDSFRIDGFIERSDGSLAVTGRLTRVGVFTYGSGSDTVKEYRSPQEVFSPSSLASLADVALTVGHPSDGVRADTWRSLAVGHVRADAQDVNGYVQATVIVSDATAIARVKSKELTEISCGYEVELDPTPGTANGESYDCIQRDIRYNHVALGPKDWGRAGPEVRLLLDAKDATYHPDMTVQRKDAPGDAPAATPAPAAESAAAPDMMHAVLAQLKALTDAITKLVSQEASELDAAGAPIGKPEGAPMDPKAAKSDNRSAALLTSLILAKAPTFKADGKSIDALFDAYELLSSLPLANASAASSALSALHTAAVHTDRKDEPSLEEVAIAEYKARNANKTPATVSNRITR